MNLNQFNSQDFLAAMQQFFESLNISVNEFAENLS